MRSWAAVSPATLAAALLGLGVAPLLAANGGFYPVSWGWAATALAAAAVVFAAVQARSAPTRYELVIIGALAAFVLWLVLSMLWTESQTATALEIERTLVYLAGALAVFAVVRRDRLRFLAGGVCAGTTIVCAYSLATRLFPDRFVTDISIGGARLAGPVGYWNALGLVAAMGALLALTLVARAETIPGRALAGAAVPVLLTTLYFTFGRGAWGSLFVGLVVLVAVDRRRLQLVFAGVPLAAVAAAVIWRASRSAALTHTNATLAAMIHQGHRLAVVVAVAVAAGACLGVVAHLVGARWPIPRAVRRAAPWVTAAAVVLALALVFARFGSPVRIAQRAYDSFVSPPAEVTNLNNRLFSLSSNGRVSAWRVSMHAFEAHPAGGIGAGAYADYWTQHRTTTLRILDAHSLYLETLAETGVVGLLLLLAVLAAPLAAFRHARSDPVAAGALAAYVAYLVAAAADWDWELSGVTLTAILLGGAIVSAGRHGRSDQRYRLLPLVAGSVVALAALYGLMGNLAISAAADAAGTSSLKAAAGKAKSAQGWAPWSATPWQILGETQLDNGKAADARVSFTKAIADDPRNELLWLDLARASAGRAQALALDRAHYLNPLDTTVGVLRQELHGRPAFQGGGG